ncbi:MAG: DGQHR domain-containing protein [Methanotrichaceae archaeon]|nr:DGQHR domain-containing protein [Methanotrichaceae archaeon]
MATPQESESTDVKDTPEEKKSESDEDQEERRDFGKQFEEEVKSFLEDKFQFHSVKNNIHIAPKGSSNEIDVCGRFQNTLFIFWCTAAGRRIGRNLREKILATKQRAKIVLENYKSIPEYRECESVVFIFITKKIEVPEANIELLEDNVPKIWYADEHVLEYYADLYDKIGKYAVFNFLADFNIRPPLKEQLYLTALRTKLGKYAVYSFYVRPKHLLKFAYVARRRSKKENFYQRMLEKSRIKKIQSFLDAGGVFPTNLIISLKEGERNFEVIECPGLPKHVDIGILNIKNSYNACWIIDGQHRLYSFAKSTSNTMIPCIAFDDIPSEDERSFFIVINKKQKPIQADLLWDLSGKIDPSTNEELRDWIISNIVRKLSSKEPFIEKIYIPVYGSKTGKSINMAAFCNGIVNAGLTSRITSNCIGIENPLNCIDVEDLFSIENSRRMVNRISGVLERYFGLLSESSNEDHKRYIFGNAGIPIMLYLLEPIVAKIGRIPSELDLEKYTDCIKKFFKENYHIPESMKKLRIETTSEGTRKDIAKQIGLYIRRETKDRGFWPKMEELDYVSEIISMERRIAKLIANKLSQVTTSWEKQRVPDEIYKKARRQSEAEGTDFDENLDLGDEKNIIMRKDNWEEIFKNIFVCRDGLHEKEVELAFHYLSKVRNPQAHGKSYILTKEDFDQCNIYLQKLNRIVPEIV